MKLSRFNRDYYLIAVACLFVIAVSNSWRKGNVQALLPYYTTEISGNKRVAATVAANGNVSRQEEEEIATVSAVKAQQVIEVASESPVSSDPQTDELSSSSSSSSQQEIDAKVSGSLAEVPGGSPATAIEENKQQQTTAAEPNRRDPTTIPNRLVYHAMFGLGHRFSKMSSAYHLATRLRDDSGVPLVMVADWGACQNVNNTSGAEDGRIFEFLFGDPILLLPGDDDAHTVPVSSPEQQQPPREIRVTNDCPLYFCAQDFKTTRVPIPHSHTIDNDNNTFQASPLFHKMDSDVHFYQLLQSRFEAIHPQPKDFREKHSFDDHTVIGLHIRAGNGEQYHFQQSGRGVQGTLEDFLDNLERVMHDLIRHLQTQQPQQSEAKPLLLFLATDTPTIIPKVQEMAARTWDNLPVVTFEEQVDIPLNQGVSFKLNEGQACLQGWKAQLVDNILLASANVLVAAMYSSFTQGQPLAMVFGRNNSSSDTPPRYFCEVSTSGETMTCTTSRQDWLFRNMANELTFGSSNNTTTARATSTTRVVHKVTYHFPDVEMDRRSQRQYQNAIDFLKEGNDPVLPWGGRFNQKYRRKQKGNSTGWNIIR